MQLRSIQGQSFERLVLISNAIGGNHAEAVSQCLGHVKVDIEAAAPLARSDAVHYLHTLGLWGESDLAEGSRIQKDRACRAKYCLDGIFAQVRRGSSNRDAGESKTSYFASFVHAGGKGCSFLHGEASGMRLRTNGC